MTEAEKEQRVRMMLDMAWESMEEGRNHKGKQVMRTLRRSWQYGGGKKKAAKIAIGLGFGAVFVGVSVATMGAGAPVIAAIAIGSFLVGQMSDAGFAKLAGRSYRGKARTASWVDDYRKLNSENQKDNLKTTDERAHKTIRRAYEHYRRGVRKARDAATAYGAARTERTCDAAADMVLSTFSVAHHFDKAILYEFPAVLLCRTLLAVHKEMVEMWTRVEPASRTTAGKILQGHQKDPTGQLIECDSQNCFVAVEITQTAARPGVQLWDGATIDKTINVLDDLDKQLTNAGFDPDPPQSGVAGLGETRARQLFQDAGKKYHENRKRLHVKFKHGVTNMWARKTSGERKGFVAGKAVSVGLSAAGGGISGAGVEAGAWFDALVELGLQGTGLTGDQIIGKVTEDEETGAGVDVEHHDGSTKSAAEAQSSIQKAAVHLYEISKLVEELQASDKASDCDTAVARMRDFYKIPHHLEKTQVYLSQAIGKVVQLGQAINKKTEAQKKVHDAVYKTTMEIVAGTNHGNCSKVCYGPGGNAMSGRPAKPL